MIWFFLGLGIWLLLGALGVGTVIYWEATKKGEDVTLEELLIGLLIVLLGPLAFVFAVNEILSEYKNFVVIHGRKEKE